MLQVCIHKQKKWVHGSWRQKTVASYLRNLQFKNNLSYLLTIDYTCETFLFNECHKLLKITQIYLPELSTMFFFICGLCLRLTGNEKSPLNPANSYSCNYFNHCN